MPNDAFIPELDRDRVHSPRRQGRPELVPVLVCPLCGDILPGDTKLCPRCYVEETLDRRVAPMGNEILQRLQEQTKRLYHEISGAFGNQEIGLLEKLPVDEPLQELQQQAKGSIQAVDVLAASEWRPLMVPTKGTAEKVQVIGKDSTRRSVAIVNLGAPAIGGSAAIPAQNVWLGTDENIGPNASNTIWIPGNGSIRMTAVDAIYAVDDGANPTVLYVVAEYIR